MDIAIPTSKSRNYGPTWLHQVPWLASGDNPNENVIYIYIYFYLFVHAYTHIHIYIYIYIIYIYITKYIHILHIIHIHTHAYACQLGSSSPNRGTEHLFSTREPPLPAAAARFAGRLPGLQGLGIKQATVGLHTVVELQQFIYIIVVFHI